jgi:hypothetical protein
MFSSGKCLEPEIITFSKRKDGSKKSLSAVGSRSSARKTKGSASPQGGAVTQLLGEGDLVPIAPPHGLNQAVSTFGDIFAYIRDDHTLDPRWQTERLATVPLPFPIPAPDIDPSPPDTNRNLDEATGKRMRHLRSFVSGGDSV